MPHTDNYLFVYGTLLDERNPFAAYLKTSCSLHSRGRIEGRLFDLGEYPGAISEPGSGRWVHGSIFRMDNAEDTLKKIDDYEGFDAIQPQPNEFVRELADIETAEGVLSCWIYLYNLPVEGHWHIVSGDYLEYIGV